jgi:ABC transporter substrate binding protein
MRRREFIAALGGAAAWQVVARAQQSNRVRRIGWLASGGPISYRFSLAAFRDGLRALNYVEGQNINIEYRWAEGNLGQLPELAKDLVDQKVDIILAGGSSGAVAAMRATSVIPIVNAGTTDLVQLGLVKSLGGLAQGRLLRCGISSRSMSARGHSRHFWPITGTSALSHEWSAPLRVDIFRRLVKKTKLVI